MKKRNWVVVGLLAAVGSGVAGGGCSFADPVAKPGDSGAANDGSLPPVGNGDSSVDVIAPPTDAKPDTLTPGDADADVGDAADVTLPPPPACSPVDGKRCAGGSTGTLETCAASGAWVAEACPAGFPRCVAGACVEECTPGQKRCKVDSVETCKPDGTWNAGVACTAPTATCSGAGVCSTGCGAAGATRCSGDTLETCDGVTTWGTPVACAGDKPKCLNANGALPARCGIIDCTPPDESGCLGGGRRTCKADSTWDNPVACAAATPACLSAPGTGTCGIIDCTPGESTCSGTSVKPCKADSTFGPLSACPATAPCAGPPGGAAVCTCANPPCALWAKGYGDASVQKAGAVATDSAGNVIVLGQFVSNANFGGGTVTATGTDAFLVKLDPGGGHLRSATFSGLRAADPPLFAGDGLGVAVDSTGNVFATGTVAGNAGIGGGANGCSPSSGGGSDMFVVKFNANLACVWAKRFTGAGALSYGNAIAVDAADNVLVGGQYKSTIDFGGGAVSSQGGSTDIVVLKLTNAGGYLAQLVKAGSGVESVNAITADAAGNVYITGKQSIAGGWDLGCGLVPTSDSYDVFAAKLNGNLACQWSYGGGDAGHAQYGTGIAVDAAGNAYISGTYNGVNGIDFNLNNTRLGAPLGVNCQASAFANAGGGDDAFVVKLDSTGKCIRGMTFGAGGDETASVALDAAGNLLLTGAAGGALRMPGAAVNLASFGGRDIYVGKYTTDFAHLWSKAYGNTGAAELGSGVAADAAGNLFVVGMYAGASLSFDLGASLPAGGGSNPDAFVTKFAP